MLTASFKVAIATLAAALLARFVYMTYGDIHTTFVALLK